MSDSVLMHSGFSGGAMTDSLLVFDIGSTRQQTYIRCQIYWSTVANNGFHIPAVFTQSATTNYNDFEEEIGLIGVAGGANGVMWDDWGTWYGGNVATPDTWHVLEVWLDSTSTLEECWWKLDGKAGMIYATSGSNRFDTRTIFLGLSDGGTTPASDIYIGKIQVGTAPKLHDILDYDPASTNFSPTFTTILGTGATATMATAPVAPPASMDQTPGTGSIHVTSAGTHTTFDTVGVLKEIVGHTTIYSSVEFLLPSSINAPMTAASGFTMLSFQRGPFFGGGFPNGFASAVQVIPVSGHGNWGYNFFTDTGVTLTYDVWHKAELLWVYGGASHLNVDGTTIATFTGSTPIVSNLAAVAIGLYFSNSQAFNYWINRVKIGTTNGASDLLNYDPSIANVIDDVFLTAIDSISDSVVLGSPPVPPPSTDTNLQNGGGARAGDFIQTSVNNANVVAGSGVRFFEGFEWRFTVSDLQLDMLTWAQGLWKNRQITIGMNQSTTISAALDPEDFRVNGLVDQIIDGDLKQFARVAQSNRIVWCWRRDNIHPGSGNHDVWRLRASGIIMVPEDEGDPEIATTTITAYDPWKYLEARPVMDTFGSLPGPNGVYLGSPGGSGTYIALNALLNTIQYEGGVFIDAGDGTRIGEGPQYQDWGGTSLYQGTIEVSAEIDMKIQQGMSVAEAWNSLCDAGNLDLVLTPIYDPSRTRTISGITYYFTHELSVYKVAGNVRPNALFTWDRMNKSAAKFTRMHDATPGQFFDKVQYFAGQGGFPVPSGGPLVNTDNLDAFGSYWQTQFWPAFTSVAPLNATVLALAQQALNMAKQGHRTITITTVPERAPIPLLDYNIADLIQVHASRNLRATADGFMRVQALPIAISDDGIETVESLVVSPDYRTVSEPPG